MTVKEFPFVVVTLRTLSVMRFGTRDECVNVASDLIDARSPFLVLHWQELAGCYFPMELRQLRSPAVGAEVKR